MDEIRRCDYMPADRYNVTKEEADAIVAAVLDATDTTTQRTSSNTMEWVLMMQNNVDVMAAAGTPYAIVKALGEWKDRIAIRNIARSVMSLVHIYLEDGKVQLFELLVPHMNTSDGVGDKTEGILCCTLYYLANQDSIAQQRLRDIPDVMQKLDACEQHIEDNPYLMRFITRMRSLSPSGKITKAARA